MLFAAMSAFEQKALPRIALRGKRRRPLEDRLALRFPTLATALSASCVKVALAMPRRWRLRQLFFEYASWRAFNAIGRGDLEILRTFNHTDVVYDLSRWGWPEASLYRGRDGLVRFNEEWIGQWSDPNFDVVAVEELRERGVWLIHLDLRGTGRTSGVDVQMDIFELIRFRDGLVWRNAFFRDRAEAIASASEQGSAVASPLT
jgi:ketosteroid isomerase-like protein